MPNCQSRWFAGLAAIMLLATAGTAAGQPPQPTPSRPPNLRIQTVGGFLGQIEGFCEDPGGEYEDPAPAGLLPCELPEKGARSQWRGGTLGANARIDRSGAFAHDWLIVAPDNVPARSSPAFFAQLAALRPDVVGIGQEDFFRWLQTTNGAPAAVRLIRSVGSPPWLATNVAISVTTTNAALQNEVIFKAPGYKLHLDPSTTVGWTPTLEFEHPALPAGSSLTSTLEEFDARPSAAATGTLFSEPRIKPGDNGADSAVAFEQSLRPDRWYRLKIREGGADRLVAVFRTNEAFTPIGNADSRFAGYPVALKSSSPGVMVVALVDPDTKDIASTDAWKWREGGMEYALRFDDPSSTLTGLLARASANGPPPLVILVSALSDARTAAIIAKFPEIRFSILPAETELLARASKSFERGDVRFSGDLGFVGVLDGLYERATKVMVRPEWFGETLVTVKAAVAPDQDTGWTVKSPVATVDRIPGATFRHTVSGGSVQYTAALGSSPPVTLDTLRWYYDCPDGPSSGDCVDFKNIWSKADQLALVVGDALRQKNGADLAVVSQALVDPDYRLYVQRHLTSTNETTWLSRYILERLLYRSPRFVRAYIPGADLVSVLDKAIKQDEDLCIAGIASGCPTTLATDHPERVRVNGRAINPALVYAVVVPDSLAESLELDHSDASRVFDLLEASNEYFVDRRWRAPLSEEPSDGIADRLESQANRRFQTYLALPTLDVGFTVVKPIDPEGRDGVRKNLGLPFSGAKQSRTLAIDVAGDLAYYDRPRFAVRSPILIDYTRRKEKTDTSYDSDEISTGWLLEGKFGIWRPFGGLFLDGQLADHDVSLTATRPVDGASAGFERTETASFTTTYTSRPRRFWHTDVGLAIVPLSKWRLGGPFTANLKTLGARVGYGGERNVPIGVSIDGVEQTFDTFVGLGGQKLLDDFFAAHPDTFGPNTELTVDVGTVNQRVIQLDFDGELAFKPKSKEHKASITYRYRNYEPRGSLQSDFQLERDTRIEIKVTIAAWWRLKIVPSYTYQRAKIQAEENSHFKFHQGDIKVSFPIAIRGGHVTLIR